MKDLTDQSLNKNNTFNETFYQTNGSCQDWRQSSSRLVSLMELLQTKAEVFCRLTGLVGQIMAYFDEDRIFALGAIDAYYSRSLTEIVEEAKKLKLRSTLQHLRRVYVRLSEQDCHDTERHELLNELNNRIMDDLEGTIFLSIPFDKADYYENPRKNWEVIIARFPDTVSDIEEASKCFALSRYAAAVFHSLHVVECGLIELGKYIGVADPKSGWTAGANELSKIVKKTYHDRTDFEKQNAAFLEQVQGTVEALKNAWRNKISHVSGRLILMTTDLSPDIAEEILFATRAFMRRLVEGLPPPRQE
jgi:hypothetical protein